MPSGTQPRLTLTSIPKINNSVTVHLHSLDTNLSCHPSFLPRNIIPSYNNKYNFKYHFLAVLLCAVLGNSREGFLSLHSLPLTFSHLCFFSITNHLICFCPVSQWLPQKARHPRKHTVTPVRGAFFFFHDFFLFLLGRGRLRNRMREFLPQGSLLEVYCFILCIVDFSL